MSVRCTGWYTTGSLLGYLSCMFLVDGLAGLLFTIGSAATHAEAPAASRNAARSVSAPPSASAAPAERLEAGLSQSTSTATGGSCMRFPDSPSWNGDLSSSPPLRGYSWHARAPCLLICAKPLVDSDSVLSMGREEHERTLG
ncbi:hypothetical protein U9M48_016563 [Paspalum notatum var. saurae]|uniref:Uncharacterized protein n=1 Tax=Paspalum notatum var. saurae TaxID=547442 RepID=A0AAQ3WN91_PASNO